MGAVQEDLKVVRQFQMAPKKGPKCCQDGTKEGAHNLLLFHRLGAKGDCATSLQLYSMTGVAAVQPCIVT